jgi:hypothetical protein
VDGSEDEHHRLGAGCVHERPRVAQPSAPCPHTIAICLRTLLQLFSSCYVCYRGSRTIPKYLHAAPSFMVTAGRRQRRLLIHSMRRCGLRTTLQHQFAGNYEHRFLEVRSVKLTRERKHYAQPRFALYSSPLLGLMSYFQGRVTSHTPSFPYNSLRLRPQTKCFPDSITHQLLYVNSVFEQRYTVPNIANLSDPLNKFACECQPRVSSAASLSSRQAA